MVAGIGHPQIARGIEGQRLRMVERTLAHARAQTLEAGLAVHGNGFHARGVTKRIGKAHDPVIAGVGHEQIAAGRIHRQAAGAEEALVAQTQGIGRGEAGLPQHQCGPVAILISARVGPRQDAMIQAVGNVQAHRAATGSERHRAGPEQLGALDAIGAVLPQVGLPQHAVGAR